MKYYSNRLIKSVFKELQDSLVSILVVLTFVNFLKARVHQDIPGLHHSLVSNLLHGDCLLGSGLSEALDDQYHEPPKLQT